MERRAVIDAPDSFIMVGIKPGKADEKIGFTRGYILLCNPGIANKLVRMQVGQFVIAFVVDGFVFPAPG